MSSPRRLLELRKEVLVARGALQRLEIVRERDALRESLRWPRAAAAMASSPGGRSMLLSLLLLVAGRGRRARFVRVAGVVALAGLAGALALRRRARED